MIDNLIMPTESTRNREGLCLGIAAVLHALMFLWNPTMLKSDWHAAHDFVTVDIVDQSTPGSGAEGEPGPKKNTLMQTLKDMLMKPKEEEIAHVAPGPEVQKVAAPMQPSLQERRMPHPIATAFQPQSQAEDLAMAGPKSIDLSKQNIPNLPPTEAPLKAKAFGGIRTRDLPFQVGADAGIATGGSNSIPIALGNGSAKDAMAYSGPSLKQSGHAPVGMTGRAFSSSVSDVATMGAGGSRDIAISGTGGSGNAPTGSMSGSVLRDKAGTGSGGGGRGGFMGSGRGNGIGSGIEGVPSSARQLDNQIAGAGGSGHASRQTKKAFEIAGPLNNRTIVKKVIPQYPAWAEEQGIIGSVRLYFTVTPEGLVRTDIRVTKTTGYPALDQLGIDALKQWQFAPKPSSDEGQGEWGIITFNFSLSS